MSRTRTFGQPRARMFKATRVSRLRLSGLGAGLMLTVVVAIGLVSTAFGRLFGFDFVTAGEIDAWGL